MVWVSSLLFWCFLFGFFASCVLQSWLFLQRPVCRTGGRVTFWFRPESNQRYDSAEGCPAELAARLQRYAQTAAGNMKDFHEARQALAGVGVVA